jgi:putative hydrolase of the HAD superfamily
LNNRFRGVRTILFDVGNTLTWLDLERAGEILAGEGHPFPPAALADAEAKGRAEMVALSGRHPDADRWTAYVNAIFRELGLADSPALPRLRERVLRAHREEHLWRRVRPDTPEVLQRLADRGYRLGVVSNSDGRVPALLAELELAERFDAIIDSRLVGVEKPDPRIFAIALERLREEAGRAVHVGDLPAVDGEGARRAGLEAVLLDPLGLGGDADFPVIRELAELLDLLPPRAATGSAPDAA